MSTKALYIQQDTFLAASASPHTKMYDRLPPVPLHIWYFFKSPYQIARREGFQQRYETNTFGVKAAYRRLDTLLHLGKRLWYTVRDLPYSSSVRASSGVILNSPQSYSGKQGQTDAAIRISLTFLTRFCITNWTKHSKPAVKFASKQEQTDSAKTDPSTPADVLRAFQ